MRKPRAFRVAAAPLLMGAMLSACALGPDYRPAPPSAAAAGAFVSQPAGTRGAALPDQWWRLYDDPALDGFIGEAFAANTDLRVAMANLARARAILSEARAGRFPSTTASGGATWGRSTVQGATVKPQEQWTYQAGFDASWEVDIFGRVSRSIEAARADAEALAAARDAAKVSIAAETTRAYVNACALGASAGIARASLALAENSLRIVTAQQRAGSASTLDVERAGVTAAQARAAIAPLEGQRRAALFELAALMGRTPSGVPEAAARCTHAPELKASIPVGDGTALLRRRPDVREAERRLAADTARIGVAMADLYPRITLGGSAGYLRNDEVRGSNAFSFSLGPLISWSFPNIAVARARVRQAEAQSQATLATFDGVVLNALKETEQALTTYGADLDQRSALAEARDRAERAFDLAQRRYGAGSISYLDVLVAQTSLLDARLQLATVEQRLASDRVTLFKALGGGWQEEAK
ncbi:MAG TPA: efflux transporter outer membrane subunit [Sphingomonadaceae bacterium]|nr:efflux transporter outer membrane subunit [Sphingomonadaceae bacterium]